MTKLLKDDTAYNGRIELKFVTGKVNLFAVNRWLLDCKHPIVKAHPPKTMFNLYFDSPDFECYEENLAGIAERTKLRLRWNGEINNILSSTLEIKRKEHGLGYKDRFKISQQIQLQNKKLRQLVTLLRNEVSLQPAFEEKMNMYPIPIIINSYQREYYEVSGTEFRITIDKNHEVFSQIHKARINTKRSVKLGNTIIIELKFPPACVDWANSVLEELPILRSRSSKYVQGLEAVI